MKTKVISKDVMMWLKLAALILPQTAIALFVINICYDPQPDGLYHFFSLRIPPMVWLVMSELLLVIQVFMARHRVERMIWSGLACVLMVLGVGCVM